MVPKPDLQGLLQNPNGEAPGGVGGEPQAEVWVGLGDPLQGLLQIFKPLDQEVAVLQHQPLPTSHCRLQQLQGQLCQRRGEESWCPKATPALCLPEPCLQPQKMNGPLQQKPQSG